MFEAKTKEIGGIQFKVQQFGALEALRLQAVLMMKLMPSIGRAFGAVNGAIPRSLGQVLNLQLDGRELAGAINELFEKLPESEFMTLIKRLLQGTTAEASIEGEKVWVTFSDPNTYEAMMNQVFGGQTLLVYQVLAFVLEVNYPDFFKMLAPGNTGGQQSATAGSRKGGKSAAPAKNN